jgi:hypothetical protein
MTDRHIIAVGFRDLAESFLRMGESPARNRAEVIHNAEAITQAGKLTISSAKAGYLKLPGLAKLVKWSEGPAPEMKGRKSVLHPGPENVFYAVSGNLLPAVYPDVFPPNSYLQQILNANQREQADFMRVLLGKAQCEEFARACRVLARLVEVKRQGGGGKRGTKNIKRRPAEGGQHGGAAEPRTTQHEFGLVLDETNRRVRRAGYTKEVDLSPSPIAWHIFTIAVRAAPKQAAISDLQACYPGEWSARATAVNDLNHRLKPLEIKVHNRTLKPLG